MQARIVEPLYCDHLRGKRFVHNEEVVHMIMAGGQRGGMDNPTDDAEPVGIMELRGAGVGEAFTIFQVNAQNVDTALAEPPNPGDLHPMTNVRRQGRMWQMGNANTSPGKYGVASRPMVLGSLMCS